MLISMTLPVGLSAQAVGGKLVDENGRPLAYANVVVLSLPDSAFVTGTVSNEDGAFRLDCPEGRTCCTSRPWDKCPVSVCRLQK